MGEELIIRGILMVPVLALFWVVMLHYWTPNRKKAVESLRRHFEGEVYPGEELSSVLQSVDLGTGIVSCAITLPEKLFYDVLSKNAGMPIENDAQLLTLLTELSRAKQEYDKVADALSAVRATGYGVVMPQMQEMALASPEVLRKGGAFGVKLKASAPSIHMIRVDIDTEISPMVGSEKQSTDLISYLGAEDDDKLWQSNIFGKSVYELIQEGLSAKLLQLPEEVRGKFRTTLQRIVNEGAQGLVCLIL